MGTMFQVISCHDLLHQNLQFFLAGLPAGLDGSFAGNGVQDLVTDILGIFSAAVE